MWEETFPTLAEAYYMDHFESAKGLLESVDFGPGLWTQKQSPVFLSPKSKSIDSSKPLADSK